MTAKNSKWDKVWASLVAGLTLVVIVGTVTFMNDASAQDVTVKHNTKEIDKIKPRLNAVEDAVIEQRVIVENLGDRVDTAMTKQEETLAEILKEIKER